MYDIIIAGAGSAGLYAAKILEEKFNVLILEKKKKRKKLALILIYINLNQTFQKKNF